MTTPDAAASIRALVEKWRKRSMDEETGRIWIDLRQCADELDALLASPPPVSPSGQMTRPKSQWELRAEKAEAERDQWKAAWEAELEGAEELRKRFGARDNESFIAFIAGLAAR